MEQILYFALKVLNRYYSVWFSLFFAGVLLSAVNVCMITMQIFVSWPMFSTAALVHLYLLSGLMLFPYVVLMVPVARLMRR